MERDDRTTDRPDPHGRARPRLVARRLACAEDAIGERMGDKSAIEWTDATWNPTVGCDRISPGCANCYAKAQHDMRHTAFLNGKNVAAQYARPFETLQLMDSRLDAPLRWRSPRRIFVN